MLGLASQENESGLTQVGRQMRIIRFANLQRDALKARVKSGFLKDYKKELIAAMKRDGIGTKDYQVSYFLNNKFVEVYTSAGGQYRAVGKCC